jgi:hypothetical protein
MAVFCLACAAMVAGAAWSTEREHRVFATEGQRAEAVVLRLETAGGRRASSYPVFAFTTARGEAVEARSSAPGDPARLPPGTRVTVIHAASNPGLVRDAAGFEAEPGFSTWILGALGLLLAAGAAAFVARPLPG